MKVFNHIKMYLAILVLTPIFACLSSSSVAKEINKIEENVKSVKSSASLNSFMNFNDTFYSFKICNITGKCQLNKARSNKDQYFFESFAPPNDEFYLKKNKEGYVLYYKNIYNEDVLMGWANSHILSENDENLILGINKVFLTMGGVDFLLMGDNSNQVQSRNYKKGIYFLNDNYDKNPYYQKQEIKFTKKKDGTIFLDCKAYMKNEMVKKQFSGIFYNECSDESKIYFKKI